MPRRVLVIDGDDKKHFFLSMLDGMLTVGTDPSNPEIAVRDLRAVRIHCEVEVDADADAVVAIRQQAALGAGKRQEIHTGEAMHVGHSHVKLATTHDPAPEAESPAYGDFTLTAPEEKPAVPAAATSTATATGGLVRRLLVIDGADQGRSFPLNSLGITSIGKSPKHAHIVLHDLYVARVHCELAVEEGRVVVTHREGQASTQINGKPITHQELQIGDVLRVGNSHLRFEMGVVEKRLPEETVDDLETYATATGSAPAKPAAAGSGSHPVLPPSPADALIKLEHQILGNYQFGALLGRGQSGLIFRAHHRQSNQPVTVKVLSPEFPADDAELQHFIKALKSVAALRHPHLVTLYAAGKTGPYCWIAREYVEGESLQAVTGPLPIEGKPAWKRACRVAVHLGRVLDFLHQSRVFHGNITSANVLIQNGTKTTKLADLMLHQAIADSALAASIAHRKRLAELPYCAPEQLTSGMPKDACTDLYSVGAVLYTQLTGQPPYAGETADAIVRHIQAGRLMKPSKYARDVPPPFEAAIMKLLARQPEDRFQSAGDMLSVIEPIANMHEIA